MQVAWLYNIRGTDVSYCPVVHAFAIITSNSAFLYVDKKKVSAEVSFICNVFLLQPTEFFFFFYIFNFQLFSDIQDFSMIFILYSFTFISFMFQLVLN
jgi:hypothetical protein